MGCTSDTNHGTKSAVKMDSKPCLGYWDVRGRGNEIKYHLAYSGVDYTLKTYESSKREEWEAAKPNLGMPFPNLPYIQDGDVKISETLALHMYIASKWNPSLCGKTMAEKGEVLMQGLALYDRKMPIIGKCFGTSDKKEICDFGMGQL
jgi:glutathione S-transferase